MHIPGFLNEENKSDQKKLQLLKIAVSLFKIF